VKATLTGPSLSFTIHSAGVLVEIDGAPGPAVPPPGTDPVPATGYDLNTSAALLEAFNDKLDPLGAPDMAKLGPFGQPGTWTVVEEGFARSNSCYRWTAGLVAPVDGEYEFTFWFKSGGSLWLDGELLVAVDREEDALSTATGNTATFTRTLTKGRLYPLKAHASYQGLYYGATLSWKRPDRTEAESVSTAYLHPPADWQTRVKDYAPPPPEPLPYRTPDENYQAPDIARPFPADHYWNVPIADKPVDPQSDAIIATLNGVRLHPVFGKGGGIPFQVVADDTPETPFTFTYAGESDSGGYAIGDDPIVEGDGGDGHVISIRGNDLHELFAVRNQGGQWQGGSGAKFDMRTGERQPGWQPGWTSADAAGMAILPGLVRADEVAAGKIEHALRVTVGRTRYAYVWPATHRTNKHVGVPDLPPMGARLRLKSSVDLQAFPPRVQVILRALRDYGAFIADNGSESFIGLCGTPDRRWDDTELAGLKTIKADSFEVVEMGPITESN
jgi:hypothetical protein